MKLDVGIFKSKLPMLEAFWSEGDVRMCCKWLAFLAVVSVMHPWAYAKSRKETEDKLVVVWVDK